MGIYMLSDEKTMLKRDKYFQNLPICQIFVVKSLNKPKLFPTEMLIGRILLRIKSLWKMAC
jgi:hypothetical protein